MNGRTKGAEYLKKLREEPQVDMEIPGSTGRKYVERLKMTNTTSGSDKVRARQIKTVYYLVGDERRAVRKFINVNPGFVKPCFEDDERNLLSEKLPDELFWLMEQEYEIMKYNGEI